MLLNHMILSVHQACDNADHEYLEFVTEILPLETIKNIQSVQTVHVFV